MITFASQSVNMRQIFQRLKSNIAFVVAIPLLIACDKDLSVSLDQSSGEEMGLIAVDTMTIESSLVELPFLPAQATERLLIGKATDPVVGSIESETYFRIALENTSVGDIPEDARYDSINLIIRPDRSKYVYGDTTQKQTFLVHRLIEDIKLVDPKEDIGNYEIPNYVEGPSVFTDQETAYQADIFGQATFSPKMNSLDSVNIKLDQDWGEELFTLLQDQSYQVANNEEFLKYFKGLVIRPHEDNSVVLGFNDTVQVELNYSYPDGSGFYAQGSKQLVLANKELQYNKISYDRTATPYQELSVERELTAEDLQGEPLFIQSGSGVVAKLKIPALNEFMYTPDISINKVELIVEVEDGKNKALPPPNNLMLLIANENNNPFSVVRSPFVNNVEEAVYRAGDSQGKKGRYVFNLIDYVKSINNKEMYGHSLMITTSTSSLFHSTNTAVIAKENGRPKIKLNIVYTKFQ